MNGPIGRASFPVFGTSGVVLVTDRSRLDAAVEAVTADLDAIDAACSRFRTDSDLERLNRASGRWTAVGPVLFDVIERALQVARATDGAVDPTVGDALVVVGYDRDFALVPPVGSGPATGRPAPGYQVVELDRDGSRVRLPGGVRLDLGATAKALAADRAATHASDAAGSGVLISLGGDISVAGPPPTGGWAVGIADAHDAPRSEVAETVTIDGGGLATSSTSVRRWWRDGVPIHHIIDPRTGSPAREVWLTVSVASASCVDANAAATAAIVMGEAAPPWLASLGLPSRLQGPDGRVVRLSGWPRAAAA